MHQVPARVRRRGLNHIKEAAAAASFLLKSFDQTFSKVCAGRGRAALVARRNERNTHNGISIREANYWFIFFVPAVSARGESKTEPYGVKVYSAYRNGICLICFFVIFLYFPVLDRFM